MDTAGPFSAVSLKQLKAPEERQERLHCRTLPCSVSGQLKTWIGMGDLSRSIRTPPPKSSPHIAFVWGTNISEFLDPPSNSAKAKAWARARARVETRPRANARARVRDRIRARATELGLEGGNNF